MTHLGVYASPLFPQYDLVCASAWMLDLSQAILNLGFLAGAFILGYAADRYSMSSAVLWFVGRGNHFQYHLQ